MKPLSFKSLFIVTLILFSTSSASNIMAKEVKNYKMIDSTETSRVGGAMKGTRSWKEKSFRVSSGNIIIPNTLSATTISPGHGGLCKIEIVKSKKYTASPAPGLPPITSQYPVEIKMITNAVSPGCTLFNPKCVGRSSKRTCEFTFQYTD